MLGLGLYRQKGKEAEATRPGTLVEVYGKTEGSITGANRVVVAPTGCCKSSIKADQLDVAGEVFGDVDVEELVIRRAGRLHGRAKYKRLILTEGAIFCPTDCGDKTETSPATEKVAVPPPVPPERPRILPSKLQPSSVQLQKVSEQRKKAQQAAAAETEQQEPSFTTSF
ncbi:MAG: polymer-forming cytoskeletal protein [bacterium]|jgi:hypothetical protein